MPYVLVSTSAALADTKKDALQNAIGELISIIPGKNKNNTMIKIEGGCDIYMGGKEEKAVFCEIRIFGDAGHDQKAALYKELRRLFYDELDIDSLYLNFNVFREWGSGEELLAL